MEMQMIRKTLDKCSGNLSAVAAQLGITRQTLYNKMKKYAFNYSFRVAVSLAVALLAGVMWTVDVFWGAFYTALLPIALYWQQKLYRHHVRKVLFMLDAIENNDNAIHFSETENTADARLVNRALNRVAHILYNVKSETAQQEKYYELILDCVNTGILVLNDNGAVYQKQRSTPFAGPQCLYPRQPAEPRGSASFVPSCQLPPGRTN